MAARLSNDELAERVRTRVRRNCAKYRERLARSGRTQTLIWLPDAIRAQLDGLVEARNLSLSAVTTDLLSAALAPSIPPPARTPTVDSPPLFDTAGDGEAQRGPVGDRLALILALKREQPDLSNYAIAAKLGCSEPTVRRELKRLKLEVTP